jgi:hypothetical protein
MSEMIAVKNAKWTEKIAIQVAAASPVIIILRSLILTCVERLELECLNFLLFFVIMCDFHFSKQLSAVREGGRFVNGKGFAV